MFKIILIFSYLVFALALMRPVVNSLQKGKDRLGRPPVKRSLLLGAKSAMGVSLGLPISILLSTPSWPLVVLCVKWISLIIFTVGSVIFFLAMYHLGDDALRVGLPKESEPTTLKTGGLYRFSRNPIYLAVFIMMAASQMLYLSIINIFAALFAVWVHHMIVISEERFLEFRFKDTWIAYKNKVRRYI